MNSFNTDTETLQNVLKYSEKNVTLKCFQQSRYPRIYSRNLMPVPTAFDDDSCKW